MKKALILASMLLVCILALSFISHGEEKTETNEPVILKTIEDKDLNVQLQKNFVRYFDKVSYVTAHYTEDIGFYYLAYGVLDGNSVKQGIKVNESDIENNTYTYADFSNIEVTKFTQYCTLGPTCPCVVGPQRCEVICGPYVNGICEKD